MKRLSLTAALFAALLAFVVLAPPALAQDTMRNPDAEVYVDGLACPFCAYGLEKKLKTLDAIQAMEVQIDEGRVLLDFKEGKRPTEDEIQQAVEKAGFTARKIEFADEAPSTSGSS